MYVFYLKTIMSDESTSPTLWESRNLLFFSFPVEKHAFRLLRMGGIYWLSSDESCFNMQVFMRSFDG